MFEEILQPAHFKRFVIADVPHEHSRLSNKWTETIKVNWKELLEQKLKNSNIKKTFIILYSFAGMKLLKYNIGN